MKSLVQLEKHQIGLRLPKYLIDELDELTRQYKVNRSEIITEAIRSYIKAEKEQKFYDKFNETHKEIK